MTPEGEECRVEPEPMVKQRKLHTHMYMSKCEIPDIPGISDSFTFIIYSNLFHSCAKKLDSFNPTN